ncbi:MAG: IS1634 family transposase, partial [Candidatus Omnitrophica bacterium]|nr:IS1634 family transposase [Candidatus Omnitrophota bacterium]
MFLRRNIKQKKSGAYEYWTLVETVRTARGPRQRIVATIGKLPGLDKEERVGWEEIRWIVQGIHSRQWTLFDREHEKVPEWATVNLSRISVENIRQFGDTYLGLLLWRKLGLDELFTKLQPPGAEKIEWKAMFCLSVLARFCMPSSELRIAESWYEKTVLPDILGVPVTTVNDDRLYRTLDRILPHKDAVCKQLQERYKDLFSTRFDFLFYDVTSTYFEGECKNNAQAKRGYSRDKRPDCLQVCIGLVVTKEGLPVGYEVFDGNRRDVTTLEEIIEIMEGKYGQANRIWVMDRGCVSEENLEYLREGNRQYVVGTPRSMLKKFEQAFIDQDWQEVEAGIEVKSLICSGYDGETFILCKSEGRSEKERAILKKQKEHLEKELLKIQNGVRSGRLRNEQKIERRIGRWLGRYTKASPLFEVKIMKDEQTRMVDLAITYKQERWEWAEKVHGKYLLRTNIKESDPKRLWKIYMQLNQAETAFRMSKSEMGLRPIFHQREDRVQAHIFICFLALAMWKTLELWMGSVGLGHSPRKLMEEFKEIRSLDIVVPIKDRPSLRLRVVGKPATHVRILLHKMGLKIPNRPILS